MATADWSCGLDACPVFTLSDCKLIADPLVPLSQTRFQPLLKTIEKHSGKLNKTESATSLFIRSFNINCKGRRGVIA